MCNVGFARVSASWSCYVYFMLVYLSQGGAWLFRRTAGRGPCPRRWRMKTTAPPRGSKDERVVVTKWPLNVCYRGLVCHGAKWQRWKKANAGGSMKRFFRLREQRALKAREEIRSFWESRGVESAPEGPLPPPVTPVVSSSSSEADSCAAEREYLRFMATGPSDDELLEWVLRDQRELAAACFAPPCS